MVSDDEVFWPAIGRLSNLDHELFWAASALDVGRAVPAVIDHSPVGVFGQRPEGESETFDAVHPTQIHTKTLLPRPTCPGEDSAEPAIDQFDMVSAMVLEAEVIERELFEASPGKAEASADV